VVSLVVKIGPGTGGGLGAHDRALNSALAERGCGGGGGQDVAEVHVAVDGG
jgi:hypothetical protein